jgi:predicted RNase H-like HicB family nuclease
MPEYRVVIERDESGAWIARIPEIRGCHSYGRTLEQARRRIREALSLWVDDAGTAHLDVQIRLPQDVRRELRRSASARERAERDREQATAVTRQAATALVRDLRLGMRDAAELLGISHQRVQQLVRSG